MLNVQVYAEGTHLIIPWFERPVIYDVRAKPHLVESTSGSRDLQMVNLYLVSVPESRQDYVFERCGCIQNSFLNCFYNYIFFNLQNNNSGIRHIF